jgi:lysophospholipase L1-like esterase
MLTGTSHRLAVAMLLVACFASSSGRTQTPQAGQQAAATTEAQLAAAQQRLERLQTYFKDWAQMARYRDQNAQVNPPRRGEARVVFMGDSITDFWAHPEFGGFFATRPPYIDRGISGQITAQMLLRFRRDVIALGPSVVVILAGTNDLAGNGVPGVVSRMPVGIIEDNLASMADLAKAHGIRVVLASVLPVSDYSMREGATTRMTETRPPAQILALNEWIRQYCAKNGFPYLDYFSAMVDASGFLKKELSEDGLHPNAAGYAVMGLLAEKAIAAALRKKR